MSTITEAWNASKIVDVGGADATHGIGNTRDYGNFANGQFVIGFTGTAINLRYYLDTGSGNTAQYQIDGGGWTTLANNTTNTLAPLVSSLSDTAHELRIRVTAGSLFVYKGDSSATWSSTSTWQVTGASPSLQMATGWTTPAMLRAVGVSSYIEQLWGRTGTAGGYTVYQAYWPGSIAVKASITNWRLFTYLGGQKYLVRINGVEQTVINPGTTSTFDWVDLVTGGDGSTEKMYEVILMNGSNIGASGSLPSGRADVVAMVFGGGSGANTNPLTYRRIIAVQGDSLTAGGFTSGTGATDIRTAWPYLLTKDNWARDVTANRGIGSTTTENLETLEGMVGTNRLADLTGLPHAPDVLVYFGGSNDIAHGAPNTEAQFKTDDNTCLSTYVGISGIRKVVRLGISPRSAFSDATRAAWNTDSQNNISGLANAKLSYIEPGDNGVNLNYSTMTSDGTHWNDTGQAIIKNLLAASVAPAAGIFRRGCFPRAGKRGVY